MPEPTLFGTRLAQLRHAAGLTQQQLADRAGMERSHVARLETGQRAYPTFDLVQRLAKALGVSVNAFADDCDS